MKMFTFVALAALTLRCFAQQNTGPRVPGASRPEAVLRFDIASVKQCKGEGAGRSGVSQRSSPGRIDLTCASLADLIHIAYDQNAPNRPVNSSISDIVQPMKGGPGWIYDTRFTVEAKAEETSDRRTMMGPMLQALLEERFKLKVHQETEEIPVYELAVAKGGFKLHAIEEGACVPISNAANGSPNASGKPRCGTVRAGGSGTNKILDLTGMTVAGLARMLRGFVDRPIIDQTGITGLFNFHLEYAPDEFTRGVLSDALPSAPISSSEAAPGQSIFGALQQQLGLKLEQGRGPHGYLVIDHVERLVEN